MKKSKILWALLFGCVLSVFGGEYSWQLNTGKKSVFKCNETITFTGQLLKNGKPAVGTVVQFVIKGDNKISKRGKFTVSDTPWSYDISLDFPGWVYVNLYALDAKGKRMQSKIKYRGNMISKNVTAGVGALVEPEKLQPPRKEPADFDAFWQSVKKDLASVPLKELEKVPVPPLDKNAKVKVYDIKVACAGGMPVSGYLAMPDNAGAKSCPAIVTFHGSGVKSATQQLNYARRGMIALDINAHGIVNGKDKEFYLDLRKNRYFIAQDSKSRAHYAHWDRRDREKYYFRGMYMRVMRALEYVKSLPEWDGKNLIVSGTSQGGAQVIAACALDGDVSLAQAGVPAMCDHSGVLAAIPRSSGWPALYKRSSKGQPDDPAVAECASYYDGCYFASRIKCPIYISTGLLDTTCPPTSVFAAYNCIPAGTVKNMTIVPDKGHSGVSDKAFRKALDLIIRK